MMPRSLLITYRIYQVFSSFCKLIVVVSFSFELFWCYGISRFSFEFFFSFHFMLYFFVAKGKCPTLNVICCGWAKHDTEKCETSSENGKWTLAFSKRKKSFFLIHASAASGLLQCPLNLPNIVPLFAHLFRKKIIHFLYFSSLWILWFSSSSFFPLFYVPFLRHSFHSKVSLRQTEKWAAFSSFIRVLWFSPFLLHATLAELVRMMRENLICELIESLKVVTFISIHDWRESGKWDECTNWAAAAASSASVSFSALANFSCSLLV